MRASKLAGVVLSLVLALALALAVGGVSPAAAAQARSAFSSELGITLTSTPDGESVYGTVTGASTIGIQLTAATQSTSEYAAQSGASVVGIRLTATPAGESEYASERGASTIGIRLTQTPQRTSEYESQAGASTIGIRLTATPTGASEYESQGGTSTIGIRLTATPSEPATYESPTGASTVGIRLTGMESYNVYFATYGGTPIEPQRVRWGDTATRPATNPTREPAAGETGKFNFTGWFADEACTTEFDFDAPITSTTTVHAGWSHQVDVTLHANGAATSGGAWTPDGTWTERECWTGAPYTDYFAGFPNDLAAMGLTEPGGKRFGGWWTYDPEKGEWGRLVAGGPDGSASANVLDGATDLWARWIELTYWVEVVDEKLGGVPDEGRWTSAEDGNAAVVTYEGKLPAPEALYVGDSVPKRAGYALTGLWQEPADSQQHDSQQYYAVDKDALSVADAFVGKKWTDWQRAEDRYRLDSDAGVWVRGHDGVDDTIVLTPRWELALSATVPMWVSFAVTGFGGEPPVARGPDAEAFAIRSETAAPLAVTNIAAEGLSGMERVFYTTGEGATRELDYAKLGGDMSLALDAEDDDASRVTLAVADTSGRRQSSAIPAEAFSLEAWRPGSEATALHITFGLTLPEGIKAYESGAKGDIARVTFTLAAQQ